MAATNFKVKINEESSAAIGLTFTGFDDDEEVTPNTLTWTLTDINQVVINSRTDVSETPSTTTFILLQGDDLALSTSSSPTRILTIKGTYNSLLNGTTISDLPYTEEYKFDINTFLNIP